MRARNDNLAAELIGFIAGLALTGFVVGAAWILLAALILEVANAAEIGAYTESGDPSVCEATSPSVCWYVDAAAANGGNGSYATPYNSFEVVCGYESNGTYYPGSIRAGDYLYVKGTFAASNHLNTTHEMRCFLGRTMQGGTPQLPTVIKSWRGSAPALFDGEHTLGDFIRIRGGSSEGSYFPAIEIFNIIVYRKSTTGINIDEYVESALIKNVTVRNGLGDGNGTLGGIRLVATAPLSAHSFIVEDSLIYSNDQNPTGVTNNRGGISILAEPSAKDGSTITIQNNTIYDEVHAIRHKHNGNVKTIITNNTIYDSLSMVYVRSDDTEIYKNVAYRISGYAIDYCNENQTIPIVVTAYNNTVYDTAGWISNSCGEDNFGQEFETYNNIVSLSTGATSAIKMAPYTGLTYNLAQFTSDHNIFIADAASQALFAEHITTDYSFAGWGTAIGDASSVVGSLTFQDAANGDLRVTNTTAIDNEGRDGEYVGAIAPPSEVRFQIKRRARTRRLF